MDVSYSNCYHMVGSLQLNFFMYSYSISEYFKFQNILKGEMI